MISWNAVYGRLPGTPWYYCCVYTCICVQVVWYLLFSSLNLIPFRRIAYQESTHSFAVASCHIDVASADDPKTFKPLRQRYTHIHTVYREIFEGDRFHVWQPPEKVFSTKFRHGPPTYTIDLAFCESFLPQIFPAILYMYMCVYIQYTCSNSYILELNLGNSCQLI